MKTLNKIIKVLLAILFVLSIVDWSATAADAVGKKIFENIRQFKCQLPAGSADVEFKVITAPEYEGDEQLDVILTEGDGSTTTYTNSGITNYSLTKGLKSTKNQSYIISVSDLTELSGGVYLEAGMIDIQRNKESKEYDFDVFLAVKNKVFMMGCSEKK